MGTYRAHDGPITGVDTYCSPRGMAFVVTSGKDMLTTTWAVDEKGHLTPRFTCGGHTDAVDSVAALSDGSLVASGSWDTTICLWRGGELGLTAAQESEERKDDEDDEAEEEDEDDGAKKKRARNGDAGKKKSITSKDNASRTTSSPPSCREPVVRLDKSGHCHTQCVSALVWADPARTLVSGSWDHSCRLWDVEQGVCTETLNGSKSIFCVDVSPDSRHVVIGGADKAWRLWDPRTRNADGTIALKAFHSHKAWIESIRFLEGSAYHLVTASHDGAVKVWDLRATIPLVTLSAHDDKALCAAWIGKGGLVASGGADCQLALHNIALPKVIL